MSSDDAWESGTITIEEPTGRLRWKDGILQQEWDVAVTSPGGSFRRVWRAVPIEGFPAPLETE